MDELQIPRLVLIVGFLVVASIIIKAGLERIHVPPLVGFMLLGIGLRYIEEQYAILGEGGMTVLDFLARLGIIVLLFRVGLESDLPSLLKQLRSASLIWIGNVVLSAAAGYLACRYLLSQDFAASLTVAAAFTATSVGIPVRVWRNHEALDTPAGERFLDVAELDDITGVLLMALLFAMLPVIQGEGQENTSLWTTFAWTLARFIGMFVGFCLVCFLFSKYLEERMTKLLNRLESPPDPAIVVAGIGIVIAAAAGLMGFSVAVGAFFAGLVFSRDPERVRLDASFGPLYEFMMPFFFIGIGLVVAPSQLVNGASIGALLAVFAILSKVVGASLPALKFTGYAGAAVLGVSMIPRAEITMVIMKRAHSMGSGIVTDQLFSGMVFVSAITATFAPLVLYRMLKRYSGKEGVL